MANRRPQFKRSSHKSAAHTAQTPAPEGLQTTDNGVLQLQRLAGNQAVQHAIQSDGGGNLPPSVSHAIRTAQGAGQPAAKELRGPVERSLGVSLNNARLHTDSTADALSRQFDAAAFTVGSDVFFRQGTFDTTTKYGKRLLSHELTHVAQQTGGRSAPAAPAQMRVNPSNDHYEAQANEVSQQAGAPVGAPQSAAAGVQRFKFGDYLRPFNTKDKQYSKVKTNMGDLEDSTRMAGLGKVPELWENVARGYQPGNSFDTSGKAVDSQGTKITMESAPAELTGVLGGIGIAGGLGATMKGAATLTDANETRKGLQKKYGKAGQMKHGRFWRRVMGRGLSGATGTSKGMGAMVSGAGNIAKAAGAAGSAMSGFSSVMGPLGAALGLVHGTVDSVKSGYALHKDRKRGKQLKSAISLHEQNYTNKMSEGNKFFSGQATQQEAEAAVDDANKYKKLSSFAQYSKGIQNKRKKRHGFELAANLLTAVGSGVALGSMVSGVGAPIGVAVGGTLAAVGSAMKGGRWAANKMKKEWAPRAARRKEQLATNEQLKQQYANDPNHAADPEAYKQDPTYRKVGGWGKIMAHTLGRTDYAKNRRTKEEEKKAERNTQATNIMELLMDDDHAGEATDLMNMLVNKHDVSDKVTSKLTAIKQQQVQVANMPTGTQDEQTAKQEAEDKIKADLKAVKGEIAKILEKR